VDVKEIERYVNQGGTSSNDTKLAWSSDYKTPFGNKGLVLVRKGGGTFNVQAKHATLRVIFNSQTLPPRDPSKPPIVYLMP
jgi:large exoprotein involved in heme utilization and adhesion